ncbi:Alpha-galactosidase [Photobacterium marinum]|uniref:Alpha-galactosidase n=1 Tax=Photobacterium marinum TaxID=1056511 RepID=L8JB72_9GAMM|nr:alpha-galactosidase [Photobacterium marinum]ELR65503.1 Alpha-galactosidase [Photobacterium marinum]
MQSFSFPSGVIASSSSPFSFVPDGEIVTAVLDATEFDFFPERMRIADILFEASSKALVYGDGFQMLAQTVGTLREPADVGRCPDNNNSYRIYGENDPKRYYNYLVVEDCGRFCLFGFTSCRRFAGYFECHDGYISAFLDGEGVAVNDSQKGCNLESFVVLKSDSLDDVFSQYAEQIKRHHPSRETINQPAPVGWCSWYAYYAGVSAQDIQKNVDEMQGDLDDIEWVLLDDGYQAFMGDWLTPSERFSGGVKSLIEDIRKKGKKPGIWLAPFIAQSESALFRYHPDWFVANDNGELLKAEDITYGGWRCTPWYILDTSHPDACAYLTEVTQTMRNDWGVELFKLDANYWGTLKGKRYRKDVTGVEAYRMGMEAIAEGAGSAWLLGCNAPMWPSLGLVDAMRVSDDVERRPHRFSQIARETFYRSWQHRKLWQIDPDCATLVSIPGQETTEEAYQFHRDVLLACGGLLLSGDPLYSLHKKSRKSLKQLIKRQAGNQNAATFADLSLHHAQLEIAADAKLHMLFNFDGQKARDVILEADEPVYWIDYWSGEKLIPESALVIDLMLSDGVNSRAIIATKDPDLKW